MKGGGRYGTTKNDLHSAKAPPTRMQQQHSGPSHACDDEGRRGRLIGARFRHIIGLLVLLSMVLHAYEGNTLFIIAIGMISSDVLSSGLTELRAKHMALDPFAQNSNAASAGTCPVDSGSSFVLHAGQNATLLSERQRLAMAVDELSLFADVSAKVADGELVDWSIEQRSYIFTAGTLGGHLCALPLSRLGLVYGSKLMVTVGIVSSAVRALLLPTVATQTPYWFVLIFELVMGGLGYGIESVVYPLTAAWFLPEEASAFLGYFQLSKIVGTALSNLISTQMLSYEIDWCWCFYLPGGVLIFISLAWMVYGSDRPEQSKFVSAEESWILRNSVANRNAAKQTDDELILLCPANSRRCLCDDDSPARASCPARKMKREPDWAAILKNPTVGALLTINFAWRWNAQASGLWPTYFANMLHISPSTLGLLMGLKGAVSFVYGSLFAHGTRRFAINRPFDISLTAYRRVCQVIATLVLCLSVGLMAGLDCVLVANVASVLLIPVVTSFNVLSFIQLPLDLSPEDSGLLASYIRLIAVGDLIALPASSYVLSFANDSALGDRFTWRLVWLIGLGFKVLACIHFVLVAKAEPTNFSRVRPAGACISSSPLLTITSVADDEAFDRGAGQQWPIHGDFNGRRTTPDSGTASL